MGEMRLPSGKLFCILCNGVVSFKNGDKSRFIGHMNHEHEAFSGISFILAGCLMSQEERTAVETIMEEKYSTSEVVDDKESAKDPNAKLYEVTPGSSEQAPTLEEFDLTQAPLPEKKDAGSQELDIYNGKVKISMRSFLLENKNLLAKVESEKVMKATASENVEKDIASKKVDKDSIYEVLNKDEEGDKEERIALVQNKDEDKERIYEVLNKDEDKEKIYEVLNKDEDKERLYEVLNKDEDKNRIYEVLNKDEGKERIFEALNKDEDAAENVKTSSIMNQSSGYPCDQCNVKLKHFPSLRRHRITQHGIEYKNHTTESGPSLTGPSPPGPSSPSNVFPFTPSKCKPSKFPKTPSKFPKTPKKSTIDLNLISESKQTVNKNDEETIALDFHNCKKCDAKFKLDSNLEKHMKIAHPEPIPTPIKISAMNVKNEPEVISQNKFSSKLRIKTVESLNSSVPEQKIKESKCNVCDTCGDIFTSAQLLGDHVKSVHKDNSDTNDHHKRKDHIVASGGKVAVKTEEGCGEQQENNIQLKTLQCDQCNKQFIMERNLNLHKRMAHKVARVVVFPKKHIAAKIPKFQFSCSPCNIKFETKANLENHEKTSHKTENESEAAAPSLMKGVTISKVLDDSSSELNGNSTTIKLKIKKKATKTDIIKKEHGLTAKFLCKKCPLSFGNIVVLKRHNLKRHGESKLTCSLCRKIFKHRKSYLGHIRNIHKSNAKALKHGSIPESVPQSGENKTGKFPCDSCNQLFGHSSSLRRHKVKVHEKNQNGSDPVADVLVNDASFIAELKNKIVADEEDKVEPTAKNDQSVINKALDKKAPEVDLSKSNYFVTHPKMVKSFTKKERAKKTMTEDSNLPSGWFILESLRSDKTRMNGEMVKGKEFITPDRRVIRSVDGIIEYMKVSNNYSKSDIESVAKYFKKKL